MTYAILGFVTLNGSRLFRCRSCVSFGDATTRYQLQAPPFCPTDHCSRSLALSAVHLSLREIEEMMLERGIDVSYETIRRWVAKIGPQIA